MHTEYVSVPLMTPPLEPMSHQEALSLNAVEAYLLGDLPEADRDRFEEHYFECPICAEAVLAGQELIDRLKK